MSTNTSPTEANKRTVLEFFELAFSAKKPEEAASKYLDSRYIQHNPQVADGPNAFIQFVNWFTSQHPKLTLEVKRALADGDLVVTHSLLKTSPEDRGMAVVDICRLENGRIVEHWDVLQPVPEKAANDHTMF